MNKSKRASAVRETVKEYAAISFGILLVAIGVYFFKFPNRISTGGVTGIAVVLAQIFPAVSQSDFVLIFNIFFLILGFAVLGRDFGFKTVYGSLLLSGFLELFDLIMHAAGAPADLLPLTVTAANPAGEPVLELFFAVAFPAAGAAILFYNHGSSGGTDIVAMIIHKYTSVDSGKALLLSDLVLVLFTFWDFEKGEFAATVGLLSLAGLVAKAVAVDVMIAGINQSKYHMIITTHREEVEAYITKKLKRGATVWRCEGAYTHGEEYALVAVMSRAQSYLFRRFIKQIDPKSFVIVTNSSDILGKGFKQV
ncbi:MAG: YitT family protein [Clostridia bacterium]|nr:YitT family protein [Clostridia bacterium]